ncbi:universal stress protein [Candidatus Sulfurimonas marisnigri]|uniref:Universal stress protein n=1 Tax=Candidatus Sulfurimonas marisnigri TaxID=2740405 RepID=A0A7S7M155_9BACT|nr:universal stress protein [Candidatus Sulfurimonas marisnigri]QOY55147.1 universal stress protein [Candidatus Sulfurimonas marisnigri]
MKTLKRIVVGIDILEKSNNVLKRAFMLARENKAQLFVIHAIQIPWLAMPNYFNRGEISIDKSGVKEKIEKKIKGLNTDGKITCSVSVKEGDADDVILHAAKSYKADMIIIGVHSKSKGGKNLLGTTAQKVVNQSHSPVLIVKKNVEGNYQDILAPTDFETQSKQSILIAKNIFPKAKISVIHTYETIDIKGPYIPYGYDLEHSNKMAKVRATKEMKDFIKDVSAEKGKVMDGKLDYKKVILQYIKKDSYDLVVIGSQGTAGLKALLGSVASYILKTSPCDVLIYVAKD